MQVYLLPCLTNIDARVLGVVVFGHKLVALNPHADQCGK